MVTVIMLILACTDNSLGDEVYIKRVVLSIEFAWIGTLIAV